MSVKITIPEVIAAGAGGNVRSRHPARARTHIHSRTDVRTTFNPDERARAPISAHLRDTRKDDTQSLKPPPQLPGSSRISTTSEVTSTCSSLKLLPAYRTAFHPGATRTEEMQLDHVGFPTEK